ncbi:hypothetical protein B0H11DRAFT_1918356 [Mycena galericulata]|nr:hypothetical protein B0H11DRAFT_1918356 [Mycena galericulata]
MEEKNEYHLLHVNKVPAPAAKATKRKLQRIPPVRDVTRDQRSRRMFGLGLLSSSSSLFKTLLLPVSPLHDVFLSDHTPIEITLWNFHDPYDSVWQTRKGIYCIGLSRQWVRKSHDSEPKFSRSIRSGTLRFEVVTDAGSTASSSPSCYSQVDATDSPGLNSALSWTPDEMDALRMRWEKHVDTFRALAKDAKHPVENSMTNETPPLAPAHPLLNVAPHLQRPLSPQNFSIVRPSTPDTPLHVHPLHWSPLSTPPPRPHSGSVPHLEVAGPTVLDTPIQVLPLSPFPPLHRHSHAAPFPRSSIPGPTRPDLPKHGHPLHCSSISSWGEDLPNLRSLVPHVEASTHASMPISPSSRGHMDDAPGLENYICCIPRKWRLKGRRGFDNGP